MGATIAGADDLIEEIQLRVEKDERTLVTTLTKRMAEELTKYLTRIQVRCRYIHSDVDTLERVEIMQDLRKGLFDVLVGVNLLREGLDLPEVSLVAILDADKEGFLRNERSLVQTIGRAARNAKWEVTMYVEKISRFEEKKHDFEKFWEDLFILNAGKYINQDGLVISQAMKKAIELTYYRRWIQQAHNEKHGITATTVFSSIKDIGIPSKKKKFELKDGVSVEKELARLELEMDIAAANMLYEEAAEIRDQIIELKKWKKPGRKK